MADDSNTSESGNRSNLITAIKTPLGLFALVVLVAEGILVPLVAKADNGQRTLAIGGMLLVLLLLVSVVAFLAYRRPEALNLRGEASSLQKVPTFEEVSGNLASTLDALEESGFQLAKNYREQGDFQRLLDGLYSSVLFASGAVPTGKMDASFYGNLMELDETKKALRVRYFKGPYNDEIICRTFPLTGPKRGVASEAVVSGKLQCFNSMENELKERGESLLKAMLSIPVPADDGKQIEAGAIAVINIDSFAERIFPMQGDGQYEAMRRRAAELATLARRINRSRTSSTPNASSTA